MKKLMVLFLSMALMLTLSACGGDDGGKAPIKSSAPSESGKSQSVDKEMAKLKELYDGKWINEDPYDAPFTMEVLSITDIKMTHEGLSSNICNMFYSPDEFTSISISLGGIDLGRYSIDTETGILTYKPNDTDVFTYTKE